MRKNNPDYLGHNELMTDRSGNPYQYFHYTAWGESFAQAEATQCSFSSSYRFNAKELDQETGNYYYGARYYHPKWSVWLSVDPLASKYPSMSPYVFTGNNPIMLVDPDGRKIYLAQMSNAVRSKVLNDLKLITGLDLQVGNDGYLSYAINKTAQNYSGTARKLLISIIENQEEDNIVDTFSNSGSNAQNNVEPGLALINIDPNQIDGFIYGSVNVHEKTLGYGMAVLHELNHTESGGYLKDNFDSGNLTGDNVDFINIIRSEMGEEWGQRASYESINGIIPFDCQTLDQCLDPNQSLNENSMFILPLILIDEITVE
jgi:RHS repeat-associated protein